MDDNKIFLQEVRRIVANILPADPQSERQAAASLKELFQHHFQVNTGAYRGSQPTRLPRPQ